ncbi:hypothetical protein N7532_003957 [Penicillium argentinense]|uniref:Chromatin modification-related protein n=1 Tax=Penicillium argentinense TaxID=1131581 RepID=A0A9W9FNK7_9EURO|nr:uncharacterized protein N7532_003957 [Penicillium argentinense]KAJ5103428.1 hypothetical protein N7532_003957 [Penicillium argentinense]
MPMTDETDHSGGVILDGPFDPDAQATVTDYIDYTEYLPADIIRSLTLIRGLDDRYLESAQSVHNLTKSYGHLPETASDERPSAVELRRDISLQLDRAINARESSYAEACRLYDVVDRHFDRLSCIRQKLDALPRPPSEEPTPPPEPTPKRPRKKDATTPRITLRLDNSKRNNNKKSRRRAEHLGGFNPDSPIASTEQSDAEQPTKSRKKEKSARRPSSGVGFSTRDALALLKPPPADAKVGSEDLPWLRLTEWEMTKLRKKMKKNAVWQPSEVMIHRELALSGRGWEAYRAAKLLAAENGTEFIDCDNLEETRRDEMDKDAEETKLSNRGMKLNEAKKLKREQLAREERELLARGVVSSPQVNRKRKHDDIAEDDLALELEAKAEVEAQPKPQTKSQPEPEPQPESQPEPKPEREPTSTSNTSVPVPSAGSTRRRSIRAAAPAEIAPESPENAPQPPPSPTGSRRSTRSAIQHAGTTTPPATRPSSRRSAAAATTEFGSLLGDAKAGGRDIRIKSATPARKTPVREQPHAPNVPAPTRRRKRPAPGPISTGQDGGAAVSYGRRKAKPKKRISTGKAQDSTGKLQDMDIRIDEDGVVEEIADEPRYCLCGDVSFGLMICCENQDCDKEWFHLDCVGLSEVPPRTSKWFCPSCRQPGTDGIVKAGSRR